MADSARTEEIRARVEKATPEPWRTYVYDMSEDGIPGPYGADVDVAEVRYEGCSLSNYIPQADAEFIAHARSDVPYLLTELTALREEVERLLFALQRYGEHRTICQLLVGGPCSCGLSAALSPSPAQEEQKKQD